MSTAFCSVCNALRPVVGRMAGKAIVGTTATAIGARSTKSVWGTVLASIVGTIAGHVIDDALGGVCGSCGAPMGRTT